MSERKMFEGKDLEEAIQHASQSLNIPEDELHYEVLEQGRRGLLGLGSRNVRIRVMPPVHALSDRQILEGEAEGAGEHDAPARAVPRPRRPVAEVETPVATGEGAVDAETVADVERTVQRMMDLAEFRLKATAEGQDRGVTVRLEGEDSKLLKQRKGELLAALQFLMNRMTRRTWPEAGRVHVMAEGEGQRRDDKLIAMARSAAKQVSKTGRTRKLRPMNAYERRLVHLAVQEFPGLTSSSDGSGALKRVRISKVRNEIRV